MLNSIIQTIISLIPKVVVPNNMKHYRPISLCNVLYKAISKILINLLKPIQSSCICKNQSTIVPSWQILDNVILAHEYLHYPKNKRTRKGGFMTVKLDMSNTYHRFKWSFLRAMMPGFCDLWISWIIKCLTTTSYSFNTNRESRKYIIPKREIREGDPISHYLFLICSKGPLILLEKCYA